MKHRRRIIKKTGLLATILFVLINCIAFIHAYKFTHFADPTSKKTQKPEKLSVSEKCKSLILGVVIPRPMNKTKPHYLDTLQLQSNKKIQCWYSHPDTSLGVVVICHGYGADKSTMLDKAQIFDSLHYSVFLLDFMGSGGSEGNTTTIGFKEGEQVKTVYEYLQSNGNKNIYLYGTSMGAVAIMKAIHSHSIAPNAILIECPFGSMRETVSARFKNMNVPSFPMVDLLVFWGGVQNGFWAYSHNPSNYAKNISCPTLLLYGAKDKNVSKKEIDTIYKNLSGQKKRIDYPLAGHENYLIKYRNEWIQDVSTFLSQN